MAKRTKSYGLNNPLQDVFPVPVKAQRAPTAKDAKAYEIGQLWVDQVGDAIYALSRVSGGSATWSILASGQSEIDTLSGDSGGNIGPTGGNVSLAGGSNLTTTSSGSTVTTDMDPAITLAIAVSSPIFSTLAAASDKGIVISGTDIDASSGTDINIPMTLITKGTGALKIDSEKLSLIHAAAQIEMNGGSATDFLGETVLVAGTKTILNTNISTNDRVFVTRKSAGASTALGVLEVVVTAATNFIINARQPATPGSLETGDTSIVNYFIVREL